MGLLGWSQSWRDMKSAFACLVLVLTPLIAGSSPTIASATVLRDPDERDHAEAVRLLERARILMDRASRDWDKGFFSEATQDLILASDLLERAILLTAGDSTLLAEITDTLTSVYVALANIDIWVDLTQAVGGTLREFRR